MLRRFVDKYTQLSAPTKAAAWFTICNFLLKGISFITVPIFTRMLSDVEYGTLSLYVSYEQIFLIFATWEIQIGAYQKGIFKYKDDVTFFTASAQLLVNMLTVGFFLLVLVFKSWVVEMTGMSITVLTVLFCYLLVQPSYNCWLIRKRTAYQYKSAVAVTLLYTIVNVLATMCALVLLRKTADVKFVSSLLVSILISLFFFIPNAKYIKVLRNFKLVKEQWNFLIRFEAPLVMHSLSYFVLNQADRVIIGNIVGKAEAAYYSVAYSIANVVSIFQNSINQALLPWRYQMLEDKQYGKIKKVTNYLLMAISFVILIFILIAPEVVKFLFDENYYDAVWSIPPIAVSVYFMFLYTIFVNIETYFEKTKYVMYVSVTCGIINIILNYACIGYFGYIACGYTTLFSYILFSLGHYYFMKKIMKEVVPGASVIDSKSVLLISLVTVIISVLFTVLYKFFWIRYGLLVTMFGVVLVFRNRIADLVNQFRARKVS